jgi:orotate phosphoribosyltransferase
MQSLITHLPKLTLPPREREGFYVREKPKDHGITDLIAGNVMPGLKTLMVEDVTTSGASFLRAISAAEAAGCNIVGAITVVERAGNAKNLLSARYKFAHVFDIIEIL